MAKKRRQIYEIVKALTALKSTENKSEYIKCARKYYNKSAHLLLAGGCNKKERPYLHKMYLK